MPRIPKSAEAEIGPIEKRYRAAFAAWKHASKEHQQWLTKSLRLCDEASKIAKEAFNIIDKYELDERDPDRFYVMRKLATRSNRPIGKNG